MLRDPSNIGLIEMGFDRSTLDLGAGFSRRASDLADIYLDARTERKIEMELIFERWFFGGCLELKYTTASSEGLDIDSTVEKLIYILRRVTTTSD